MPYPRQLMRLAIAEMLRPYLLASLPADVEAVWYQSVTEVEPADVLVMGFVDTDEIRGAINACAGVRWVSTHAAGVDHYPLQALQRSGAVLTKGSGAGATPIAESVVMYILSAAKSFPYFLQQRGWPVERPPALELEGSRALILGYGHIGRAIGERLRAFGVHVTGVGRGNHEWRAEMQRFDWIVLSSALTPETRHIIGARELERMKPSAWLFNVARGGLIDQDALVEALHNGRPRGAYLDVTEPEPLPPEHSLWRMPTVFITGHSSGRSAHTLERYAVMFLDNLERFRTDRPLLNVVDLDAGY
jgi:phosphoglycerate dehydrogenase-like enzyme